MTDFSRAQALLHEFKGGTYLHGLGVLPQVGAAAASWGRRAVLVRDTFPGAEPFLDTIRQSLQESGLQLLVETAGAGPNAPREDVSRIRAELEALDPDVVIGFGGGSTLDAVKCAEVLRTLGGTFEDYFGTGLVTAALEGSGKQLTPFVAIQTAASSGAHLTKYSNITDLETGQKKLIVDEAVVPVRPVFDYEVTLGAPFSLTADGALDGIAHALEVLYGAVGKPDYPRVAEVAREAIGLVVHYLPVVLEHPDDPVGREALGLATDLGAYAIMIGGTNGGHLTSFSLVDVLSHGRACAIMNPYYTVFFAPAIKEPLRLVGEILRQSGHVQADISNMDGRELGMAVANGLISFQQTIGFPTTLGEVPGFTQDHITRALAAAKNPQLKMKLENMPVPLRAEMIDEYMGPILDAATSGNVQIIKNVA